MTVLQYVQRKSFVLGRRLPMDVALKFEHCRNSAWTTSFNLCRGKALCFVVSTNLATLQGNVFSPYSKATRLSSRPAARRLGRCEHAALWTGECSSLFSQRLATKRRHIAIHTKKVFTAGVNATESFFSVTILKLFKHQVSNFLYQESSAHDYNHEPCFQIKKIAIAPSILRLVWSHEKN